MQTYSDHVPTCYDSHIELDGREHWLVVPVSITRDTAEADQSNFHIALEMLGGESESVEVHRFGHWGPGWYEIVIVDPSSPQAAIAADIARRLEDYPLLDDDDYFRREYDDAIECWEQYGASDYRRDLQKELQELRDIFIEAERSGEQRIDDFCGITGMPVLVCCCGKCHTWQAEHARIDDCESMLDELTADTLWDDIEMESPEYWTEGGGVTFRPQISRDLENCWDIVERIEAAYHKQQKGQTA